LQKKKIITVVLLVAIVVIAFFGYEFFIVNSLSGYTKISLTPSQTYSIRFGSTAQYNISYNLPLPGPNGIVPQDLTIQVYVDGSFKNFQTIKGARYSYSGLQIVVGSVTFDKIVLYVKSSNTTSEPIISYPTT
jgi:hypothetical protein